ncbi:hypothetical protein [Desulfosporosinus youngiae]|nr:hypothetical protein [Desulfosporosinus youngiae]
MNIWKSLFQRIPIDGGKEMVIKYTQGNPEVQSAGEDKAQSLL